MKLIKYSVEIPSENEDIVIAGLCDCGVEGVEIDDKIPLSDEELALMFVDIPKEVADDGRAVLSFYLDDDEKETVEILERVKEELISLRELSLVDNIDIIKTDISKVNWADNWKKYFKTFSIGQVVIVPSWEDYEEYEGDGNIVIRMDPGSAFGTGKHETTKLCIEEMLGMDLNDINILDIGTGSGILGILGLKRGAKHITAVDIDSNVSVAVEDNLNTNNVKNEDFELEIGDISNDNKLFSKLSSKKYGLIIANILPDVLEKLTPFVKKLMDKSTVYLLSGILDIKADMVEGFLNDNNMSVIKKTQMGEWVAIMARLNK